MRPASRRNKRKNGFVFFKELKTVHRKLNDLVQFIVLEPPKLVLHYLLGVHV